MTEAEDDGIGIILPPPEIRGIIDKTAKFVAERGGLELEDKIREKERNNPKFSFLNGGDPYYAYYQVKLTEARSGKVCIELLTSKVLIQEAPKEEKQILEPVKAALAPPPVLEFSVDFIPTAAQDLDIIKLTAQFVARNGRQFMTQLQQKEARNYQFDFLRHGHSMFNYFTKLVDQYTKILLPSKELREKLESIVKNRFGVLERCVERSEWERHEEETRRKQKEDEEKEKIAFQQIDWHDFVVVQAVEVTPADERIELPPPLTIEAIQAMTLAQRKSMFGGPVLQPSMAPNSQSMGQSRAEDEDMEMEMDD